MDARPRGRADAHHGATLHANRARASSFGANAELYERTRPRYPAAFLDELVAAPVATALDVGCGTGLLGRDLAARGVDVLGVEPDAQMAAVAARHGLRVEVATFESWDARGRTFDLLVAGQAWHWVEPDRGAQHAGEVVVAGGRVAHAWNVGSLEDDLLEAFSVVYARLAPGQAQPLVPHRRRDGHQSDSERAFVESGLFDGPVHVVHPWQTRYSREEWLAQLETHSDHHLMAPQDRAVLLDAVGDVIDAQGGSFLMSYDCEVTYFTRRGAQSIP